MKTATFIFVSLVALVLLAVILWLIFSFDNQSESKGGNLFWMGVVASLLNVWFFVLLIKATPYLVMTPRFGFFVGGIIHFFFYTFFIATLIQLVSIFQRKASVASYNGGIIQIVLSSLWVVFLIWLLITAERNSPHGSVALDAPCRGNYFVMQGGGNRFVNHHRKVPAQAFAIDLVKLGPKGFSASKGKVLTSYYAFGDTLFSPTSGLVLEARDDLPDNELGSTNKEHPKGNFIRIKDSAGNIILLAHLKQGSLLVQAGEEVAKGAPIGQCGNSGNSSEPHIHLQGNRSTGEPLSLLVAGKRMVRGIIVGE